MIVDRASGVLIHTPMFNLTSFIAYPTVQDALMDNQIRMTFKPTRIDSALLFYDAFSSDGNGDFIALTIKDDHLVFQFDTGSGTA